ncbi:MAG: PilZ domain-containing protein, partial [Rhizomicrobium sp.]
SGLGDDANQDAPPPAERRPKTRKRTLFTGIVAYANGAHSFHCTIRNLSETGARLAIGTNAQFPSDFYLINIRDRIVYEARLVWNKGNEIGVTFKSAIPLAGITDPGLAFLKQLWLTKA